MYYLCVHFYMFISKTFLFLHIFFKNQESFSNTSTFSVPLLKDKLKHIKHLEFN